jgi:shikimate kinase/3-dehydroquinate synthase
MSSNIAGMQRIFLTGLSGSGKTTIGHRTADLLGWSFVDTDDVLAERMGMPVGQVLVEYGEERFRQLESEVLHDLADGVRVVIATGGGMVISEANRKFMREHGLTVYLKVSVEGSWKRMQETSVHIPRPLIAGDNGLQRLQDLYTRRRKWYEEAPIQINTEEGTQNELARRLISLALARGYLFLPFLTRDIIKFQIGNASSQAIVEWGGLPHLGETLRTLDFSERLFMITDSRVGDLYSESLQTLLKDAGFQPHIFTIPEGEASKSFQYFQQIVDWLVEHKAERQEAIIALGGGVVGDLAGFIASCYLRGVPFVQVPTTLLGQVDSALGGKTGFNHTLGKNLIGSYYHPKLIYVDPAFILTLPERIYNEGWVEIAKYAMILDGELFTLLEENFDALQVRDPALLTSVVARSIRMKMDIVQRDELDFGLRNILNYGHTFGHALEATTDYHTWLHGEAVALGMEVAAHIAVACGKLSPNEAARQTRLLQALNLPIRCPGIDIDAILNTMQRDKKVRDGRMRWVLPTHIGHADVFSNIDTAVVRKAIIAVSQDR